MKKITVADITLKAVKKLDLELTFRERLSIARNLDLSGVDAIELPALTNSKEDEIIYRTISESLKNATVKIEVGDTIETLMATVECVKNVNKACLQVVMPVSTVQMEYFYHLKSTAMLDKIAQLVKKASEYCDCVEFVALDAFRAEQGFVCECAKVAYDNGAKVITICDDAGVAIPCDYGRLIEDIKKACDISVMVQPSDELSLASACAIKAIKAGVDGVKTSVCGKYLKTSTLSQVLRIKKYDFDVECNVDATKVVTLSQSINEITGEEDKTATSDKIVKFIDKTATMGDVASAISSLGYELSDSDIGKVYEEFKKLTAHKESIDMKELEALIANTAMQVPSTYHLVNFVVTSSNIIPATANITLEKDGEKIIGVSTGDGPIDAAFHAIEQVVGQHYELDEFQVQAVTKGRGAVGSSIIRLRANGRLYAGNGVSTDIVGACIRAYINALNKIVYEEK